jgi:site-specific DNA-methyltransferase (adenine-specific)
MWEQLKRIIKLNGAIVLFSSQPFTSALVMSNPKMFKYEWVWEKTRGVGFVNAKLKPMPKHEILCVFSKGTTANKAKNNMPYYPQDLLPFGKRVKGRKGSAKDSDGNGYGRPSMKDEILQEFTNYPTSILKIPSEGKTVHPTQKPVALMEYLIKTYTNEGEIVLDFTMGSGTTGVAAVNLNRHFVGIELDKGYFDIAQTRIKAAEEAVNA